MDSIFTRSSHASSDSECAPLDRDDLREGVEEAQRHIREGDRDGLLDQLERSREERVSAAMEAAARS